MSTFFPCPNLWPALVALVLATAPAAQEGTPPAPPDLRDRIAACAAVSPTMTRLACYDTVATGIGLGHLLSGAAATAPAGAPAPAPPPKAAPESAVAPPPESIGKWQLSRRKNPLDDSETVVLRLAADSGRSTRGETISMVARCMSNQTELYVVWNDYLGDDSHNVYDDWKRVTVRIGEEKANEQHWSISTDTTATFAPAWAGNLLKRMLEADRMILQTVPYNENPVTATFDIRGLRAALGPLAETCGWSYE
jgi:type VI secretion system VasI family protein